MQNRLMVNRRASVYEIDGRLIILGANVTPEGIHVQAEEATVLDGYP